MEELTAKALTEELRALRELLGRPDPVLFPRGYASSPGALYVQRDDRLLVRTQNRSGGGVVVTVSGRLLLPTQEVKQFVHVIRPASTTMELFTFELAEGYLLGLHVDSSDSADAVADTYVEVGLGKGIGVVAYFTQTLLTGYVPFPYGIGWPPGKLERYGTEPGTINTLISTNPAAGAEISLTVNGDERRHLQSLRFQFTTVGGVSTRTVHLVIDDGTNLVYEDVSPGLATGATYTICGVAGGARSTVLADNTAVVALPAMMFLGGGYRIRTVTTNLQVGDDFSAMFCHTQRYVIPV